MKHIFTLIFAIFLIGCASKNPTQKESLSRLLEPIASSKKEAFSIAKDAINFSQTLKKEYELISYPSFNNFLINIGVKKRGLCWQLAFDMLEHLKTKKYQVDYYIAGANIGEYFTEHNVIVLTCKGCKFEKGVLLDVWRNGGDLYYSRLNEDKRYKWKQRGSLRN